MLSAIRDVNTTKDKPPTTAYPSNLRSELPHTHPPNITQPVTKSAFGYHSRYLTTSNQVFPLDKISVKPCII